MAKFVEKQVKNNLELVYYKRNLDEVQQEFNKSRAKHIMKELTGFEIDSDQDTPTPTPKVGSRENNGRHRRLSMIDRCRDDLDDILRRQSQSI